MNKEITGFKYVNELEAKSKKLREENKKIKEENSKLKKDLELAQGRCESLMNYMDLNFNIQL